MSSAIGATTGASTTTTTTSTKTPGVMDKDAFLKLLVGQLRNQDPMNPEAGMDMGQMAQFSMVEQITNLTGTTQQLLDETRMGSVLNLVGKTVTYTDRDGASVTGIVDRVIVAGGEPRLTVAGVAGIDPANVFEVA